MKNMKGGAYLFVSELEAKLLDTRFDGVPSGKTVSGE